MLGWSAAPVLTELFGDRLRYSAASLTLPGITRHYRGFSQAAEENAVAQALAPLH